MGSTLIRPLLESSGASFGERGGVPSPLHFGDPDKEYQAFADATALLDRTTHARLEHAGADALDLLHRLTTNDLLDLPEGQARRTIITTADARVVDVLTVVRRPSQPLLLLGSQDIADRVLAWLDQYTFGEDSTPRDITAETAQLTLAGPGALTTLATAAEVERFELAAGEYARLAVAGRPVEIVRTDALGGETIELVFPLAVTEEIWRALTRAGATPVGVLGYNALRVARGIPEHGGELDERVNPHEANLLPFVSFTKGCYIGQEVVARLDTYDKVQRRLVGVRSETNAALRPGMPLLAAGRPVGDIRTAAEAGPIAGHAALAYVRRGFWDSGTALQQEGGGEVRVVAWPLA